MKLKRLSILSHKLIYTLLAVSPALSLPLTSCSSDLRMDEPGSDEEDTRVISSAQSGVLIYAVASNNLESYLKADTLEMKKAASQIDLSNRDVFLYSSSKARTNILSKLTKAASGNDYFFIPVKEYDDNRYSTDPERINEVICDYITITTAERHGIVFWSHATGWTPHFSDHVVRRSFGQDNVDKTNDQCDIPELASAIPDKFFDFIWFDCCYMGSVEVAYELRNKANYIVGYPTEIGADGMPYDLTLPYITNASTDILIAAEELYSYYNGQTTVPVTIGVYDTSKLPALAYQYSKLQYIPAASTVSVNNYARSPYGPFYDLGQLADQKYQTVLDARHNTTQHVYPYNGNQEEFKRALNAAVIYKAASQRDFSNKEIPADKYSGISVHNFQNSGDKTSEFYMNLEWFKALMDPEDPNQGNENSFVKPIFK
ncbi:MAG: clostripain-related cysteine peptidase [Muribaculum sp.]|nr:clostripain-related cysteine peptidase [Muribaculum sp.]